MPELPEVETIRRDLQERLVGRTVERVRVARASVIVGSASTVRKRLAGQEVLACRRHGKVLIVDFSRRHSLLVHPRMTGQVIISEERARPDYTRVTFDLADGGALFYADCRALGKLEVCPTEMVPDSESLRRFGPDALADDAIASLPRRAGHRRVPIKALLLDQSAIAGVGNIYACEALYRARVPPDRRANELTRAQWRRLCSTVTEVLAEAIEARGTTLRDYRTGIGTPGGYAIRLAVYGREGEPCLARACDAMIERCVQQQRSTFYCPVCQARGRGGETQP